MNKHRCRKASDKIQHLLMAKLLRLIWNKGKHPQVDKEYIQKLTANTTLTGEKIEVFPTKIKEVGNDFPSQNTFFKSYWKLI